MSEQIYNIVDATEDSAKVGYSFMVFGLKYFYQVSSVGALKNSYDAYALSRFSQTIETFQFNHEQLNIEERKSFYEDLEYNEQNLHYLYSLFDKARTSTYLLHMKILARLSANLIKNKTLSYFEQNLLNDINTLNNKDILYIHRFLKNNNESLNDIQDKTTIKNSKMIVFKINTHEENMVFEKCLKIGIISIENSFGFANNNSPLYKDKGCYFTKNSFEFYEILNEVLYAKL